MQITSDSLIIHVYWNIRQGTIFVFPIKNTSVALIYCDLYYLYSGTGTDKLLFFVEKGSYCQA